MKPKAGEGFLGDRLVQSGLISREQLDEALRIQGERRKDGKKVLLGNLLVELGYCAEKDIVRVSADRYGLQSVSLETFPLDRAAVDLFTPELARRYNALPLAFENGCLVVAMKHPRDIVSIDDIRILTGHEIKPVVVSDSELAAMIERFGMRGAVVEQLSEEDAPADKSVLLDEASDKPAVQLANQIFGNALRAGASDIHIEPQEKSLRVRFRIDGVLHEIMQPPRQMHPVLVSRIKVMANMDIADRRLPQDGRMTLNIEDKIVDVRVATLPTANGEKITMRLLDRSSQMIELDRLGFAPVMLAGYRSCMKMPYGFILVTGPTGSGKTTTLYATLAELNSTDKNTITVEDPIEYRMAGLNQVQINPRAGLSFASGLRSILRNDPDIIMVGEVRDHETAKIAVESALTGHLVLSTLHTNDAAGAISRLDDMGIEPFLTASSLVAVVAQRLARLLCPHCKEKFELSRKELEAVKDFPLEAGEETVALYRPRGCLRCNNTGFKGRIGLYELLLFDENIRRLTLGRRSKSEIEEAAIAGGMVPMRRDGMAKVKQGLTSLEEVLRVVV
ncbi:MAG: ATPase, T2SS/T4P/T4SS family [Desulfotomaculaceae bacterium]|nr:ATPase, T2SS/T4P/T4SS family [Desulfotomaculaceae bacterium]